MAIVEEQQEEQSLQDTKIPSMSPQHDTNAPTKTITVKDVPNSSTQNINPLTIEDLKKILDQSTLQATLCENLVLVSIDELQKVVANITRDKLNTKEPHSTIPLATSDQPLIKTLVDTSKKVDTTIRIGIVEQMQIEEKKTIEEQIGQIDASIPEAHEQGVTQIIVINKRIYKESKDTPKEMEQESIQALVTLPTSGTPIKIIQKPSTEAIPLQILALGSSSSKVVKVIHYRDVTLHEEIVIAKYDYATITLEQIGIMQQTLEKKKNQEILRKEHRQMQAL